jgi:transcriptional regulator with XRE-family HTH domain
MTYAYDCAMIQPSMADDPAARVRRRLAEWIEIVGLTQREVAAELNRSQPWLDKILSGENSVRLKDLDDIARRMRTSASDLVRETTERRTVELTPSEFRLIERLRRRPGAIQACLVLVETHRGPEPIRTAIAAVNEAERIEAEQRAQRAPAETQSPRRKRS